MPSVLIVEDEQVFARRCAEYLQKRSWTVDIALDGAQGWESLQRQKYDAVILDRNMPRMSGDELLDKLRDEDRLDELCVVVLTAFGDIDNAVRAMQLGVFEYLQKPLEEFESLSSILSAGIAWHRVHKLRHELLLMDPNEIFNRVLKLLEEVLVPEGIYLVLVDKDGTIRDLQGTHPPDLRGTRRRFIEEVRTRKRVLFQEGPASVKQLEPIQPDAKVLMAAPLATKGDDIRGILDMESVRDHAFAPYWRQVLSYLADLIGFAMEIAEQRKDLLAREADRKSAEQLRLVYRELRHRIATLTGNLLGQADLLQKELSALEDADHNVTEPRRRVEVIRRNAEALEKEEQRLRKATQALGLDRRPIDLREAVLASVEYVRSRKSPEANEIAIEVSPGDPLPIDADQRWLEYALECVLDNAVDAITDQRQSRGADPNLAGRVSVSLAAAGNQASVTISDNGIGLDPELVEEIFAPLYSTKRQTVDNPELDAHGTGLFTARRVAQEHGGNLRASSPGPGQGAMFTFTLPLTS